MNLGSIASNKMWDWFLPEVEKNKIEPDFSDEN